MLLGVIAVALAEGVIHFGEIFPDSLSYIPTALWFLGKSMPASCGLCSYRLLRPVVPALAALLSRITDIRTSFAIENLAFWIASAVLLFRFTQTLTKKATEAAIAAILFATATPVLVYGGAVLTDSAGFFFVMVGVYLVVIWDLMRASWIRVVLAALIMSIGILSRETVASVLIFAVVWTAFTKGSWAKLVVFLAVPTVVALSWSHLVGVSYLAWATENAAVAAQNNSIAPAQRLRLLAITLGESFRTEVLGLALLGFIQLSRKRLLKAYLAILLGLGAFVAFAPGEVDVRYTFIMFPAILPLAAYGMTYLAQLIGYSPLANTFRLSDKNRRRVLILFPILVVSLLIVMNNISTLRYLSFPWRAYVDPSIKWP